jgi:2-dehydropantoate 2-reductase
MKFDPNRPLNVAVLGPGAVGGLLAGVLARQGHRVTCLARQSTCDVLAQQGITVRSKRFGDLTVEVDAATTLRSPVDMCLVTVKATQLHSALERLPPKTLDHAVVVPFLNGVEHIETLRHAYGDAVVAATIRIEATLVSPGVVEHSSPFAMVELCLADADQSERAMTVRAFEQNLSAARLDVNVRNSEPSMLWGKLSFLAPLALLTTHERASAGIVRTVRRADLLAVVHEVVDVKRCSPRCNATRPPAGVSRSRPLGAQSCARLAV